jgi:hypothetical protein
LYAPSPRPHVEIGLTRVESKQGKMLAKDIHEELPFAANGFQGEVVLVGIGSGVRGGTADARDAATVKAQRHGVVQFDPGVRWLRHGGERSADAGSGQGERQRERV